MADQIRGGIVINEIHAQPVAGAAGYDTDGNGTVAALDEYLEFFNASASPIDLGGLQLWDPGSGNWFTFPSPSVLPPGGYAIVVTGLQAGGSLPAADLAFNAGRSSALINNAGDNIYLYDPTADSFIQAGFGNWPLVDPITPTGAPGSTAGLAGFSSTATQIGTGEHFGAIIAGDSLQRSPDGGNSFVNNLGETAGGMNVCFVAGTMIATIRGEIAIERLRPGARLRAIGGDMVSLRWLGAQRISHQRLIAEPKLWPIIIAPGALGAGRPKRSLSVSPQHRILVQGPIAERMCGAAEVLVPAVALCGLPGITQPQPANGVVYYHIMCADHQVVEADGAFAETLYLGPMARSALGPEALREIYRLLPDLADHTTQLNPARPLVDRGKADRMVRRYCENASSLQPAAGCLGPMAG